MEKPMRYRFGFRIMVLGLIVFITTNVLKSKQWQNKQEAGFPTPGISRILKPSDTPDGSEASEPPLKIELSQNKKGDSLQLVDYHPPIMPLIMDGPNESDSK